MFPVDLVIDMLLDNLLTRLLEVSMQQICNVLREGSYSVISRPNYI